MGEFEKYVGLALKVAKKSCVIYKKQKESCIGILGLIFIKKLAGWRGEHLNKVSFLDLILDTFDTNTAP